MKLEIKNRFTGDIIVEGDFGSLAELVIDAVRRKLSLDGASLDGANLTGANLTGANLARADLYGANLGGANLYGANLARADLHGANLDGANLDGANLDGANLARANLTRASLDEEKKIKISKSPRPFICIYPLGSDSRTLQAFATNKGIILKTGCFMGTIDEFKAALAKKHGGTDHEREYLAALALIETHFSIWK